MSLRDEPSDCIDCGYTEGPEACPASKRLCDHHCNHSWSHERCCWCGKEWDDAPQPVPVPGGESGR
jgi:hypothetical protein